MSLVIGFTDGEVAHVVSDGTVFDGTQVLARDHRKFFETPTGLIIGTAGFLHNCDGVEHDFRDSRLDFSPAVRALERRVASAYNDLQGFGLPLGVLLIGRDGDKLRIANIDKTGATLSSPGVQFISYLAAGDAADDAMLRRLCSCALAHLNEDAREKFMREIVRIFAERIPDQIGGTIFSASLPHPAMCPLNAQMSLVAFFDNSAFSWSITTTSIGFWWSAFPIPKNDGSSVSVAAAGSSGSPAITLTGLSASTTYYVYCYYTPSTSTMRIVLSDENSGKSPASTKFIVQTINGDGNAPVFGVTIATPPSGSGGGGGGNGGGACFTGNVKIETVAGVKRFDELSRAFEIQVDGFAHTAELILHDYDGEMIDMGEGELVTPSHRFWRDGKWVPASEEFPDRERKHFVGTVYNLHVITDNESERCYRIGSGRKVHNYKEL